MWFSCFGKRYRKALTHRALPGALVPPDSRGSRLWGVFCFFSVTSTANTHGLCQHSCLPDTLERQRLLQKSQVLKVLSADVLRLSPEPWQTELFFFKLHMTRDRDGTLSWLIVWTLPKPKPQITTLFTTSSSMVNKMCGGKDREKPQTQLWLMMA